MKRLNILVFNMNRCAWCCTHNRKPLQCTIKNLSKTMVYNGSTILDYSGIYWRFLKEFVVFKARLFPSVLLCCLAKSNTVIHPSFQFIGWSEIVRTKMTRLTLSFLPRRDSSIISCRKETLTCSLVWLLF